MAVYIELYFLAYFSLFLFLMFSIKLFLYTKARILSVCAASIMFSIICFLMDFYAISIIWKALIICVYVIALTLVLHKLSHISKLLIAAGIGIFYYFCLGGINWFITTKLLNLPIYTNNFYLSLMIGINGIIFSVCFLSFGGLCVTMQTYSAAANIDRTLYFPGKILQLLLSLSMACLLANPIWAVLPGILAILMGIFLRKSEIGCRNTQKLVV